MDNLSESSKIGVSANMVVKAEQVDIKLIAAAELFGDAKHHQLKITPPAPFVPCNPSVHFDGRQWRCTVRAVDYRLGTKVPTSSSKNYLAFLYDDMSIDVAYEMLDFSGAPKNPRAHVHGYEDIRLFDTPEGISGLATCCDMACGGRVPEMVVLTLATRGEISRCRVMRGPWNRHPQKNWMPILDGVGDRFVYRSYPFFMMNPYDYGDAWLDGSIDDPDEFDFVPSSQRGSSQLVPFLLENQPGWLCVIHEHASKKPLIYAHRFMWFDHTFKPRRVTKEFCWRAPTVEFCAGLAYDRERERLVASYGVMDREAHVVELAPANVREQLHYDITPT